MKNSSLHFLVGDKFCMLTLIEKLENHLGRTNWLCRCECGNTCQALATQLKNWKKKSCGCLSMKYRKRGNYNV